MGIVRPYGGGATSDDSKFGPIFDKPYRCVSMAHQTNLRRGSAKRLTNLRWGPRPTDTLNLLEKAPENTNKGGKGILRVSSIPPGDRLVEIIG